jgi:hypothetical protein
MLITGSLSSHKLRQPTVSDSVGEPASAFLQSREPKYGFVRGRRESEGCRLFLLHCLLRNIFAS